MDAPSGRSPDPSTRQPRPVGSGFALLRIALAVIFVTIGAVLIVEGIRIQQLALSTPLVGRIARIERGQSESVLVFDYVTMDGRDHTNRCLVPTTSVEELAPGQTVEIHHRTGVTGTYACVEAGIPPLERKGIGFIYWGLALGLLSLGTIAWLLFDLARFSRQLARSSKSGPS